MAISHVLFDADGVVQTIPGGWYAAMEPYVGARAREFLHETWKEELPTMAGNGDYKPMLAATLVKYGVTAPVDEVYRDVWHRIDIIESTIATIHDLRDAGYGVHLATNQEKYRGDYMRKELGLDSVFDTSCYSYELGAAKPSVRFFREALLRISATGSQVLFIDDSDTNVAGARAAGLFADRWQFEEGIPVLLARFADRGVVLPQL